MYTYKIKEIIKIYDADTITVVVDLGFGVTKTETFRLNRINAPEMRGEDKERGIVSRDWLRSKLYTAFDNTTIYVKTIKDNQEKFGRYLAEIYIDNICINDSLVENNLAVYKEY